MLCILLAATALAEEETGYRDVVLVDDGPTEMADKRDYTQMITPGIFGLGVKGRYHVLITDRASLILGGGIGGWSTEGEVASGDWLRWQALAGVDIHPIGNGFHGFYLGPRAVYRHGEIGLSDEDAATRDRLMIRGVVGYRWVFDPGASVAIGLGGGARWAQTEGGLFGDSSSVSGMPAIEANLSWVF